MSGGRIAPGHLADTPAETAMQLVSTFERFSTLLTERLELGVFTTEDSIRYTFYTALLSSSDLRHINIVLEYPHPAIPKAQIDTIILGAKGREPVAVEFKYDRANPGGTNQNRTQRAAAALRDVFRLAKVPGSLATLKYFVYVTDAEMAGYFGNPANRLVDFFESKRTTPFRLDASVFQGFAPTLVNGIAPLACDCQVAGVFAADLASDYRIRAFEVLAV